MLVYAAYLAFALYEVFRGRLGYSVVALLANLGNFYSNLLIND